MSENEIKKQCDLGKCDHLGYNKNVLLNFRIFYPLGDKL